MFSVLNYLALISFLIQAANSIDDSSTNSTQKRLNKIEKCTIGTTHCVPIVHNQNNQTCLGNHLPYSHTSPQPLGDRGDLSRDHLQLWTVLRSVPTCWDKLQFFLCSIYFPECVEVHDSFVKPPASSARSLMNGQDRTSDQTKTHRVVQPEAEMCETVHKVCPLLVRSNQQFSVSDVYPPDQQGIDKRLQSGPLLSGPLPSFLDCSLYTPGCRKNKLTSSLLFQSTVSGCQHPLVTTSLRDNWIVGIDRCSFPCRRPHFDPEHYTLSRWLSLCAATFCLGVNVFILLTLRLQRFRRQPFSSDYRVTNRRTKSHHSIRSHKRTKQPPVAARRPVYPSFWSWQPILSYIHLFFFIGCIGWLMPHLPFGLGELVACREDGSLRAGEPKLNSGKSILCMINFTLIYFSLLSVCVWSNVWDYMVFAHSRRFERYLCGKQLPLVESICPLHTFSEKGNPDHTLSMPNNCKAPLASETSSNHQCNACVAHSQCHPCRHHRRHRRERRAFATASVDEFAHQTDPAECDSLTLPGQIVDCVLSKQQSIPNPSSVEENDENFKVIEGATGSQQSTESNDGKIFCFGDLTGAIGHRSISNVSGDDTVTVPDSRHICDTAHDTRMNHSEDSPVSPSASPPTTTLKATSVTTFVDSTDDIQRRPLLFHALHPASIPVYSGGCQQPGSSESDKVFYPTVSKSNCTVVTPNPLYNASSSAPQSSACLHLLAIALPLIFTLISLTAAEVDGDSLSGLCFVGGRNVWVRFGLVLFPLTACLIVKIVYLGQLIRSFGRMCVLFKRSAFFVDRDMAERLNRCSYSYGVFLIIITVLWLFTVVVQAYVFSMEPVWIESQRKLVLCQISQRLLGMDEYSARVSCLGLVTETNVKHSTRFKASADSRVDRSIIQSMSQSTNTTRTTMLIPDRKIADDHHSDVYQSVHTILFNSVSTSPNGHVVLKKPLAGPILLHLLTFFTLNLVFASITLMDSSVKRAWQSIWSRCFTSMNPQSSKALSVDVKNVSFNADEDVGDIFSYHFGSKDNRFSWWDPGIFNYQPMSLLNSDNKTRVRTSENNYAIDHLISSKVIPSADVSVMVDSSSLSGNFNPTEQPSAIPNYQLNPPCVSPATLPFPDSDTLQQLAPQLDRLIALCQHSSPTDATLGHFRQLNQDIVSAASKLKSFQQSKEFVPPDSAYGKAIYEVNNTILRPYSATESDLDGSSTVASVVSGRQQSLIHPSAMIVASMAAAYEQYQKQLAAISETSVRRRFRRRLLLSRTSIRRRGSCRSLSATGLGTFPFTSSHAKNITGPSSTISGPDCSDLRSNVTAGSLSLFQAAAAAVLGDAKSSFRIDDEGGGLNAIRQRLSQSGASSQIGGCGTTHYYDTSSGANSAFDGSQISSSSIRSAMTGQANNHCIQEGMINATEQQKISSVDHPFNSTVNTAASVFNVLPTTGLDMGSHISLRSLSCASSSGAESYNSYRLLMDRAGASWRELWRTRMLLMNVLRWTEAAAPLMQQQSGVTPSFANPNVCSAASQTPRTDSSVGNDVQNTTESNNDNNLQFYQSAALFDLMLSLIGRQQQIEQTDASNGKPTSASQPDVFVASPSGINSYNTADSSCQLPTQIDPIMAAAFAAATAAATVALQQQQQQQQQQRNTPQSSSDHQGLVSSSPSTYYSPYIHQEKHPQTNYPLLSSSSEPTVEKQLHSFNSPGMNPQYLTRTNQLWNGTTRFASSPTAYSVCHQSVHPGDSTAKCTHGSFCHFSPVSSGGYPTITGWAISNPVASEYSRNVGDSRGFRPFLPHSNSTDVSRDYHGPPDLLVDHHRYSAVTRPSPVTNTPPRYFTTGVNNGSNIHFATPATMQNLPIMQSSAPVAMASVQWSSPVLGRFDQPSRNVYHANSNSMLDHLGAHLNDLPVPVTRSAFYDATAVKVESNFGIPSSDVYIPSIRHDIFVADPQTSIASSSGNDVLPVLNTSMHDSDAFDSEDDVVSLTENDGLSQGLIVTEVNAATVSNNAADSISAFNAHSDLEQFGGLPVYPSPSSMFLGSPSFYPTSIKSIPFKRYQQTAFLLPSSEPSTMIPSTDSPTEEVQYFSGIDDADDVSSVSQSASQVLPRSGSISSIPPDKPLPTEAPSVDRQPVKLSSGSTVQSKEPFVTERQP